MKSITNLSHIKQKKGNIYQFDIPEDYELLDWDADIDNQPERVKKSIRKILNSLSRNGFSKDKLSYLSPHIGELDTGESLYRAIEKAFHEADNQGRDLYGLKRKGFTRADARASWLLNRYGIPGHRYLDAGSRANAEGSYDFVIWNMDRVQMVGISEDSDELARKTFYNGGKQQLSIPFGNDTETFSQIGAKRKHDMAIALATNRPDMLPQQRADAITEIEKLGESVRAGGNPKTEKSALHWLLHGHIILPEDNYKILDALRICEQRHLDPIRFTDPNEILAKYTIKEKRSDLRINPDTVPEFSNKVDYGNGITVYTVDDIRKGQQAVRSVIDTHWGENANPWCLTRRDDYGALGRASWSYWKNYNGVPKRIAFRNGRLLAFGASINDNNQCWDREDAPFDGIPYTVKENGNSFFYIYNEETGQSIKQKETLADGSIHEWYENGSLKNEVLPDGTSRQYYEKSNPQSGQLQVQFERLPDGTTHEYRADGSLMSEHLPDGTKRYYDGNGELMNGGEVYNQSAQETQQNLSDNQRDNELIANARNLENQLGAFGEDTAETYFQHFGFEPADRFSPQLRDIIERNRRAEPAFRTLMDELHSDMGGELILRKQMKSPERIILKANRLFGGNVSKVGDIWAGTLAFDTEQQLLDALVKLRQRDDVVHLDNRWYRPKRSTGYRDVISHIALNDGTVVELQLQLKDVQEVKDNAGHFLYEFITNNKRDYSLHDLIRNAGDLSKRLYSAAVDGSYKALTQSDKDILRSLAQTLALSDSFNDADEAIRDLSAFMNKVLPDMKRSGGQANIKNSNSDAVSSGYIQETERSIIVPMSNLHLTESVTDYSVRKARRNMNRATQNSMPKRKPLTVRARSDGGYDILDGNNTYSALKELGAALVPVEIVGNGSRNADNASARVQGIAPSVNARDVASSATYNEPSGINPNTCPGGNMSSGTFSSPRRYSTANGAPSLLIKYSNILENSNSSEINPDNLSTGNDGFINDETIERYSQVDTLHGTGHILLDNRFDLSKVGSGEGGKFRGWGIYTAQERGVSETYRYFGLGKTKKLYKLRIQFNDGTIIYSDNRYDIYDEQARHWQGYDLGNPDEIGDDDPRYWLATVLDDLESTADALAEEAEMDGKRALDFPEFINDSELIDTVEAEYEKALRDKKIALERNDYIPGYEMFREWDENYVNHTYPMLMNALHSLKSVEAVSIGNLYNAAVSDDKYRLYWDGTLQEQSEYVKKAIDKIRAFIHRWSKIAGFDTSEFDNATTGGELYMSIANIMEQYLRSHSPKDGITGHEKRTSLLFNRFGVPGLYFLDRFSRKKRKGTPNLTYNYVTWNENAMHITGIEPDSDQDAIEYFEAYRREHPDGFIDVDAAERFNQLVLHGTGHIIWDNRFDLRFVGTGEGGSMFGHGIYFSEILDVAESYRRMGLKNSGFGKITITLSNGKSITLDNIYEQINQWRGQNSSIPELPAGVDVKAFADAVKEMAYK